MPVWMLHVLHTLTYVHVLSLSSVEEAMPILLCMLYMADGMKDSDSVVLGLEGVSLRGATLGTMMLAHVRGTGRLRHAATTLAHR